MIVVIFYVLIYMEISEKSGILAIVDNAPPLGAYYPTDGVPRQ